VTCLPISDQLGEGNFTGDRTDCKPRASNGRGGGLPRRPGYPAGNSGRRRWRPLRARTLPAGPRRSSEKFSLTPSVTLGSDFSWCLLGELVCPANPFYILLAPVLAYLLHKNDAVGRRCCGMPRLNPTRIAVPGQLMPVNESSRDSVDDGRKSGEVSEWARSR